MGAMTAIAGAPVFIYLMRRRVAMSAGAQTRAAITYARGGARADERLEVVEQASSPIPRRTVRRRRLLWAR